MFVLTCLLKRAGLPLLGALTYTPAERQSHTDAGFARGGLSPRYVAPPPPVVPLPIEDGVADEHAAPDEVPSV